MHQVIDQNRKQLQQSNYNKTYKHHAKLLAFIIDDNKRKNNVSRNWCKKTQKKKMIKILTNRAKVLFVLC